MEYTNTTYEEVTEVLDNKEVERDHQWIISERPERKSNNFMWHFILAVMMIIMIVCTVLLSLDTHRRIEAKCLCQSCPSGWVHVGDDCFLVSNDTAKLFIFAHRECEKHGSILYQPTSHSEVVHIIGLLNFLKQKTYENFYLGLRRKGNTGGKFRYFPFNEVDDEPFTYFCSYHPVGGRRGWSRQCIIYSSEKWCYKDISCFEEHFFICKKPTDKQPPQA